MEFDKPAVYRICVEGQLQDSWSSRLAGLTITRQEEGKKTMTVLHGSLLDQAALIGVLQSLYGLQLPLVSIEYLGASESKGDTK
jgi:hypothetical protein